MKEITTLKYFLSMFFLFEVMSCNGIKQKTNSVVEPDSTRANFKSNGLENLNESNNLKDILCQNWDYKEDLSEATLNKNSDQLEILFRGYSFFSDGTVIKNPRGELLTGKWKISETKKPVSIDLIFDNAEKETKQLALLKPNEMTLVSYEGSDKIMTVLVSEGFRHLDLYNDPFYINNILWRIKPPGPETEDAIKKRLKECIHFFVLFYDQKINSGSETVSFAGLPSCFTWYAGGIYLKDKNKLQQKWINCFYNRQQAIKAYEIADKLLGQEYTWPKGERNWLKQNVYVLKQMETRIDKL